MEPCLTFGESIPDFAGTVPRQPRPNRKCSWSYFRCQFREGCGALWSEGSRRGAAPSRTPNQHRFPYRESLKKMKLQKINLTCPKKKEIACNSPVLRIPDVYKFQDWVALKILRKNYFYPVVQYSKIQYRGAACTATHFLMCVTV